MPVVYRLTGTCRLQILGAGIVTVKNVPVRHTKIGALKLPVFVPLCRRLYNACGAGPALPALHRCRTGTLVLSGITYRSTRAVEETNLQVENGVSKKSFKSGAAFDPQRVTDLVFRMSDVTFHAVTTNNGQ